jgi:ankyrin repeat protein
MKSQLIAIVAAVLLVGCGESQQYPPDISIHNAAFEGNIEAVKQHLADGVDVNAKDKHGQIPLHRAALAGRKEVVELLIAEGADVYAKNNNGETPLDYAESREHKETVNLLRKHGGKIKKELEAAGN